MALMVATILCLQIPVLGAHSYAELMYVTPVIVTFIVTQPSILLVRGVPGGARDKTGTTNRFLCVRPLINYHNQMAARSFRKNEPSASVTRKKLARDIAQLVSVYLNTQRVVDKPILMSLCTDTAFRMGPNSLSPSRTCSSQNSITSPEHPGSRKSGTRFPPRGAHRGFWRLAVRKFAAWSNIFYVRSAIEFSWFCHLGDMVTSFCV